ncbi:MAG: hypothetical protein ACRDJ4_02075 [Actinomycetota bacterium]
MATQLPESRSARMLLWRDEIPELLVWLRVRGRIPRARPDELAQYLWSGAVSQEELDRLVEEGLLRPGPEGAYELTDEGRSRGEQTLAEDFADLAVRVEGQAGPRTRDEEIAELRALKATIERRLAELSD